MTKAEIIKDAAILIPNPEHKNFTDSGRFIEKGSFVYGNPKTIKGKRKGEPFDYKVFVTDKEEIIYINNIKPMRNTQVLLGADASQSPTVVKTPSESNFGTRPVLGTIIGAVVGYYYAKKQNPSKVMMFTGIGAVAGFAAGKYLQGNRVVLFKKSK